MRLHGDQVVVAAKFGCAGEVHQRLGVRGGRQHANGWRLLRGLLLAPQRIQTLGRAEAAEGMTTFEQHVGVLAIDSAALALAVRRVRTTHVRALVPLETQPAQRGKDGGLGLGRAALLVGVLDAENEGAAVLAGETEIEERDVGRAYVRIAGGRGGDAGADVHAVFRAQAGRPRL